MVLLEKYSDLIENLSSLDGVYGVYLFGKYAKNKQTKKSDLDICFVVNERDEKLKEELLAHKTDELDVSIFSNLPLSIQFEIIKTGKILHVKDENNLRENKMRTLRKYKEESWVFKDIYKKRYGVKIE